MNIPEELKYTKDHEWISIDGEIATVGITDFAQRELGDIVYVEVETVGETLDASKVSPTVSTSTYTISPNSLCAKSVIPTVAISPSIEIHS